MFAKVGKMLQGIKMFGFKKKEENKMDEVKTISKPVVNDNQGKKDIIFFSTSVSTLNRITKKLESLGNTIVDSNYFDLNLHTVINIDDLKVYDLSNAEIVVLKSESMMVIDDDVSQIVNVFQFSSTDELLNHYS